MTSTKRHAILFLCGACLIVPNASHSSDQQLVCNLSARSIRAMEGQPVPVSVVIKNSSTRELTVPWLDELRLLSKLAVLTISVEDESGGFYSTIPDPGPVFVRRQSHYRKLAPNQSLGGEFDLCSFHNSRYSTNVCSRPGKYAVTATYSNSAGEYWEVGLQKSGNVAGVWSGHVACNEINIEIAAK